MKKAYLVIDLGTGNSRAALSDTKGNIIDLISFENIYHVDKSLSDAKYFLPQQWFDKIMSATSSLLHIHSDYHLIAITLAQEKALFSLTARGTARSDSLTLIDAEMHLRKIIYLRKK